ncbi:MAG TPA: Hsp20/alpha crystallin family protein [Flavobacteriaceae bacterium]|nr:Hsp20/alpha crystallin family protein [Flavobacteriaceae bacterium]
MKTVNRNDVWLPKLLDSLFFDSKIDLPRNWETFNVPAVNILENSDSFVLEIAAPGLKKEDFSVEVEKDLLKISAGKTEVIDSEKNEANTEVDANTESEEQVDVKIRRKEFNFSKFIRSFKLPENINTDEIQANYENGVLKLKLPKVEEKVLKRMVEIS